MSQAALNRFYIFVATNYNNNWDGLRADMDCLKHDDVITQAEFGQFINTEASELQFSRNDILNVFSQINVNTKGKVKGHGDVYEQTGLNENEQQRIEANMQIYGEILEKLTGSYNGAVSQFVSSHPNMGLTQESVINAAFELLLGDIGLNSAQNLNEGDAIFKKYLNKAVGEIVKEHYLEFIQNRINSMVGEDYPGLANDPALKDLLNNFFNTIDENTDLNAMNDGHNGTNSISNIIRSIIYQYVDTTDSTFMNEGYSVVGYQYQGKMNELQIARLEQHYNQALSGIDLDKYAGIIDAEAMINQFIEGKKEYWRTLDYTKFQDELDNVNTAITEFKKTLEAADHVIDMLGFDEDEDIAGYIKYGFKGEGHVTESDNNWYASKIMHDLYYELGLNGAYGTSDDGIDKFKAAIPSCYDGFVKEAAKAILADPSAYGLDLNNLDKAKLTDLITKYIIEHNADALLNAAGVDGQKKALAMISGAEMICAQASGSANQWKEEDAIEAALRVLEFFTKSPYGPNSKAYALLEEFNLNSEEVIRSSSAGTLKANLGAFFKKAANTDLTKQITPTGGTGGAGGTGGSGDLDGITNPLNDKFYSDNSGLGDVGCTTIDNYPAGIAYGPRMEKEKNVISVGVSTITQLLNDISSSAACFSNLTDEQKHKVDIAKENTLSFYKALLATMTEQTDTSDTVRDISNNFKYKYKNADGSTSYQQVTADYTYCHTGDDSWDGENNYQRLGQQEAINKGNSSCGVYWIEIARFWPCANSHVITFDVDKVWEKFKEFYDMLG